MNLNHFVTDGFGFSGAKYWITRDHPFDFDWLVLSSRFLATTTARPLLQDNTLIIRW
jgi:hypothetical protein